MIRYASDRYLDIEILIENAQGLKIPKSAVVEKDCYEVPTEYIVSNGETDEQGVLVYNNGETSFRAADVYYTDTEKIWHASKRKSAKGHSDPDAGFQ